MSSKIGEHAYETSGWTPRAPIVKAFNCGPGPLQAAAPNAPLFYRKFFGNFDPYHDGSDLAWKTIADLGTFRAPGRLWIELFVGPDQNALDYVGAQIKAALPACRQANIGLAAFSWYTGQPEPQVWQVAASKGWYGLDPAIDVISVQEYTNNGIVNDPVNVGRFKTIFDAGWTGRVAILEAGYDSCGQPNCGWQSALTEDQFYAYLHDYDNLLGQYPKVMGATVFNAPGWPTFEFHDDRGEFNIGATMTPEQVQDQEIADEAKRLLTLGSQNALMNEGFKRLAQGKINGAAGLAAVIVALQGGAPLDFTPIPDFS